MRLRPPLSLLAAPAALLLADCAVPPKAVTPAGNANDVARCSSKVTPDVLIDGGITKPGLSGLLSFALTGLSPSPSIVGNNAWTLAVHGADGSAVAGAALSSVVPFMPDHGHGSQVVPSVVAAAGGFTINNLYFFMPGLWQVTVTATAAGGVTDSAQFNFCVGE